MKKINKDTLKLFDPERNLLRGLTIRTGIEFLLIALVMAGIGWFIHCKITYFLNKAMERSVVRHIATYSTMIQNQFERELRDLSLGAHMASSGRTDISSLGEISALYGASNSRMGVISSSGKTIVGTPLLNEELEQIEDVFEDQNVVTYIKYKGLLFAVPIRVPGEGICAYYELYPNEYLRRANDARIQVRRLG